MHEAPARPDLIAVPSFSVSRWRPSTPARRIWRHMAISRAYEFGAFVAISDWSTSAEHRGKASAGAGGIAHPYPRPGERLFDRLGRRRVARMQLAMGAIDTLRRDRVERRFLSEWTGRPGRLASHSDGQPANSHGGPIGDTGAGVPDLSGSE